MTAMETAHCGNDRDRLMGSSNGESGPLERLRRSDDFHRGAGMGADELAKQKRPAVDAGRFSKEY